VVTNISNESIASVFDKPHDYTASHVEKSQSTKSREYLYERRRQNIKTGYTERGCERVTWVEFVCVRIKWWGVQNRVMNGLVLFWAIP
jgi:hypothetical protein